MASADADNHPAAYKAGWDRARKYKSIISVIAL